jgi:hypothetical protein
MSPGRVPLDAWPGSPPTGGTSGRPVSPGPTGSSVDAADRWGAAQASADGRPSFPSGSTGLSTWVP